MLNDLWRLDMDDDPADCDSGDCVRWERVESDVSKEELGDRPEARTVRAFLLRALLRLLPAVNLL